jgi:hypothetical protein
MGLSAGGPNSLALVALERVLFTAFVDYRVTYSTIAAGAARVNPQFSHRQPFQISGRKKKELHTAAFSGVIGK